MPFVTQGLPTSAKRIHLKWLQWTPGDRVVIPGTRVAGFRPRTTTMPIMAMAIAMVVARKSW